MRIGLIGLGVMGFGMARNILAKHGQLNAVAHSSRHAIETLKADGAVEYDTPSALAENSDIILLCLPNSHVVEKIIAGMQPRLRPRHTIVDTGTSSLTSTEALAAQLAVQGVHFAESPLTGGQQQAEEGRLGALVGATEATFNRISPVLEHFCETIQHFGPVGAGTRAKFINNYMVIGMAALVTEAFHMAAKTDTDLSKLYNVVIRGSADSGVFRRMVGQAKEGNYGGYVFSVENASKDMGYITEMNVDLSCDTLLNYAVKAFYDHANTEGLSDLWISELLHPENRAQLFGED